MTQSRRPTVITHAAKRTFRLRAAPLLSALTVLTLLVSACGRDRRDLSDSTAKSGEDGDRAYNADVTVDEVNLRGMIAGGTLTLNIPLTSRIDSAHESTLNVSLMSVDGKEVLGTKALEYSLGGGESGTFEVELDAPVGVTSQSDFVHYNVRIDDGEDVIRVTRSLLYVLPLYDLRLEGPGTLDAGRTTLYRVRAHDALDNEPIAEQEIVFDVLQGDEVVDTQTVTTEATGDAQVEVLLDEPGAFSVRARTSSQETEAAVSDTLDVDDGMGKLLLTTDKPIYQPGQLIHLRSLALEQGTNEPTVGTTAFFEIEDGKGNKIFKKEVTTDAFGVAFTQFRLGNVLNEGAFKVRVVSNELVSEKTVNVSHYALPKYEVTVSTEKPWYAPGETVTGLVDSRYFFGKAVAGSVVVETYSVDVGTTLIQTSLGTLDAEGRYEFSSMLPSVLPGLPLGQGSAVVELRVTVTDSAGQEVQKSKMLTVSAQGASVVLVPESGSLIPGLENELSLFASDPLGAPLAEADVTITSPSGVTIAASTDEFGQARLSYVPTTSDSNGEFAATLTLEGGQQIASSFSFFSQDGSEHLLLRTDKAVYEVGESVQVEIVSTEDDGTVYLDWANDGQIVDLRTLETESGSATFTATVDSTHLGSNRIEAYLVDGDGQIVRTGRSIFVRSDAALDIKVETDKNIYAPGAPAQLTLSVTDETGAPAVAALGLQIVDEAVFSLVDAKPGLLRTYFEIDDRFAVPQYQIAAPPVNFSSAVYTETASDDEAAAAAAQRRTGAAMAAMANTSLTGIQQGSLSAALANARTLLEPTYEVFSRDLKATLTATAHELAQCTGPATCSNGVGTTEVLSVLAADTYYDFWGNTYATQSDSYQLTLTGMGPDEKLGTSDDKSFVFTIYDVELESPNFGDGDIAGDGDGLDGVPNAGSGGSTASGGSSASGDGDGDGPRVRKDFPETLYVNPSIITDSSGKAMIDLSMADSITEWRLSALANSADGKLGGVESGITVFQDFFVDVNFPAALTRGDEVTFPVVVYNYLDTAQNVDLELQAGAWYTPLGATTTSLSLAPGEVKGIAFPVRVESVGLQTLTVVATGSELSDAVARTVRVIPDGKAYPSAYSGRVEAGSISQTIDFPADAVPGSQQLYVDVFPAFLSQAVQGMDSILATPNGCFEQTTSSAWPNVLVTEYMAETGQITPEIQLKAEALMSAGYQRLLTFEHSGGGFSWFGEQDPAPYLSVTAFGIMEFSDMARVHPVDEAMIERTIQWIEGQQQADGSFPGDMSEFFSFHTSVVRNTAFTAWALASAGSGSGAVEAALSYVKANLGSENDAYTLGIVANAFALGAQNDPFLADVLSALDAMKISDDSGVHWDTGDTQTNFYSGGNDAIVSATALVAHAMLLDGSNATNIEGALQYLTAQKDPNGNFGSTQATIWALRTLLLAAKKGSSSAVGTLVVSLDGDVVQSVELSEAQSDVMTRVDLSGLVSGAHDVTIDFAGTGMPSYSIVASHHIPWSLVPVESPGPLSIDVAYDKTSLFVDESITATVTLENNEAVTQNMVLVTLGIAPGFEVDTADLAQYLDSGAISRFEVTGRQLIVYITALAPNDTQLFTYDLRATMPVSAVDGGAEASLYYQPEQRTRHEAQALVVAQN